MLSIALLIIALLSIDIQLLNYRNRGMYVLIFALVPKIVAVQELHSEPLQKKNLKKEL